MIYEIFPCLKIPREKCFQLWTMTHIKVYIYHSKFSLFFPITYRSFYNPHNQLINKEQFKPLSSYKDKATKCQEIDLPRLSAGLSLMQPTSDCASICAVCSRHARPASESQGIFITSDGFVCKKMTSSFN